MRKSKSRSKVEAVYVPERPVKLLRPKSESQEKLIKSIRNNSITFANGVAGTGKTFIASSLAIEMLQSDLVSRIILTRPYVPAGEKLGFIPGEIADKFAPYLEPYLDCFVDRVGKQVVSAMLTDGRIQAKPISFLQGKTFNDSIVLVDEVENATADQIKLILTRMGEGTKAILMGDPAQTYNHNSGFVKAMEILKDVPKLGIITFSVKDVVRSETCKHVLEAYERANESSRI